MPGRSSCPVHRPMDTASKIRPAGEFGRCALALFGFRAIQACPPVLDGHRCLYRPEEDLMARSVLPVSATALDLGTEGGVVCSLTAFMGFSLTIYNIRPYWANFHCLAPDIFVWPEPIESHDSRETPSFPDREPQAPPPQPVAAPPTPKERPQKPNLSKNPGAKPRPSRQFVHSHSKGSCVIVY
jgi:hypothetical protein